jgi:hypothetical protein
VKEGVQSTLTRALDVRGLAIDCILRKLLVLFRNLRPQVEN